MEILTMGKVVVSARIDLSDLIRTNAGDSPSDQVRGVEVDDALVDTDDTLLSLPTDIFAALGLKRQRTRTARSCSVLIWYSPRRSV